MDYTPFLLRFRCVFGEMLFGRPVLQGISDQDQLDKIFQLCGSPTEDNMPGWSSLPGLDEKNVSFQISKHYQRKLKEDFEPYVYLNQGVKVIVEMLQLTYLSWSC